MLIFRKYDVVCCVEKVSINLIGEILYIKWE